MKDRKVWRWLPDGKWLVVEMWKWHTLQSLPG